MIASITHHFLGCLFAIHESFGDDSWSQELIALTELLEEDSVGETKTADPDPFQHTVATQLVQNKRGHDLPSLWYYVRESGHVFDLTVTSTELHVHGIYNHMDAVQLLSITDEPV